MVLLSARASIASRPDVRGTWPCAASVSAVTRSTTAHTALPLLNMLVHSPMHARVELAKSIVFHNRILPSFEGFWLVWSTLTLTATNRQPVGPYFPTSVTVSL